MVAGSRSSLRRPTFSSRKSSTSSSPLIDNAPPLLPQSGNSSNALRSKRARASTVSGQQPNVKRRRLSTSERELPQVRIPLRGRGSIPKVISPPPTLPPATPVPKLHANAFDIGRPLDSPIEQPQYDQIKVIEEKAKASIRGASLSAPREERRKLRSEDGGSRAKTELAQYFPDFEEMLSLKPPDPESLTVRSKVVLVDDTSVFKPEPPKPDTFGAHKPLHKTEIIQLSRRGISTDPASSDPLGEEAYLKIHAKAERHEKQMKNGDRERAQHEKYQLEKLLGDLRGPDWLKTLGITGITETEKKRYEPKRALFIRETQALIDKFKRWKEEEKRRRLEKEQTWLEETTADDESTDDTRSTDEDEEGDGDTDREESVDSDSSQAPNSSEIDALASQQLIEEAKNANKRKRPLSLPMLELEPEPEPEPEPVVHRPFVSFFDKRHLRDAAMAGRQRGRTVLAFGQPLPELFDREFELPDDILTEEAIRTSQRSRRRIRRGVDD